MQNNKLKNQAGVSYVELLLVITILVIVSTIALMNIGSSKKQLGRQNVARELKSAFERARFDSVKRRAETPHKAYVVITANSFKLVVDANQNGTLEVADERLNNAWMTDVSIRNEDGTAIGADRTLTFDKRGEMTATGGNAVFLVCNGDCSTPNSSNSNVVLVTKTGTVNVLGGGTAVPTFSPPSVTDIPNNNGIVNDVRVN